MQFAAFHAIFTHGFGMQAAICMAGRRSWAVLVVNRMKLGSLGCCHSDL